MGTIDVDRFAYVPSQLWMLNTVHVQDFSNGDAVNERTEHEDSALLSTDAAGRCPCC